MNNRYEFYKCILYISPLVGLFLFSCADKTEKNMNGHYVAPYQMKIGFGSCLKQNKDMPIFEAIKSDSFDLFLMLGDNVYGDSDSEDLRELRSAYKKQKDNFKNMNLNFSFEAIWDDHDYGLNDGGKNYPFKEQAKELFLDFWDIPLDDVRRSRRGLYYDLLKNADEKDVHIIFLDTRTFRDKLMPTDDRGAPGKERYIPNLDRSLTMLGEDQWDWLRKKLAEPSDYKIIVTSIQFLPIGHGWESWNNLPYERDRLINMIDNSGLDNIAILSGDRHRGGLYQLKTSTGKTISEITSSSLNAAFPNSEEAGPLRIGGTFVDENYGVLYFHSDDNALTLALKNIKGEIVRSLLVQN